MNPWLLEHQQILSRQFSEDNLPHAILVNGVTGAGKLELAQWLLHLLSCQQPQQVNSVDGVILQHCGRCKACLLLKSQSYPDHINLVAEKTSLGVDDIRQANAFLQKTAQLGKFKTILIENAQTMTQAAANALLKTLEEPSANSVIILLTNDIEVLLPTIISRCRVLNIRPDIGQSLLQEIPGQVLSLTSEGSENNGFVNLTQLHELTDKATNDAYKDFKQCYVSYLCGQQVEAVLLQKLLAHEYALRWLEQITVNLLREQFIKLDSEIDKPQLTVDLLNRVYKIIISGGKLIKCYTQANKQLVCEQLIMAINQEIESQEMEKAKINA